MPQRCRIVHTIRGRMRLRIEAVRVSGEVADALEEFLYLQSEVSAVRLNTGCGSVTILYRADADSNGELLERVEQFVSDQIGNGHFRFGNELPEPVGGDWLSRVIAGVSKVVSDTRATLSGSMSTLWASASGGNGAADDKGERPARLTRDTLPTATADQKTEAWHTLTAEGVLRQFSSTAERGLSTELAEHRLCQYGFNALERVERRSNWAILFEQFTSLPVAMLLGSAVLCVATGGMADAIAIVAVVLINAGIGYVTETHSEETIAALLDVPEPSAKVLRNGESRQVPVERIVPGDVLVLAPGTYLAADGRLILAERLTIDESSLTGESMPVFKFAAALGDEKTALRDRQNMVYRGTVVTGGRGLAVVVATGRATEMGQIRDLVSSAKPPETPVQRQLRQMGTTLGIASGAICAGLFVVGLIRGYGLLSMLKGAISLAVAAVPEGLPMVATTTLALGVNRMQRLEVVVRRLDAVETIGSVQVFCFDKTGTITLNRMKVAALFVGMEFFAVSDDRILNGDGAICPDDRPEMQPFLAACVLCNETRIADGEQGPNLIGSPTEAALVELAVQAGVDVERLRDDFPLRDVEYRTEDRPLMSTLHASHRSGDLLTVKGRPGDVLERCGWYQRGGESQRLTDADRETIEAANDRMAGDALRVLGVAYREGVAADEGSDGELTWLGLVGIADPIRGGIKDLIGVFHRAGIRTVMITGDQSATAYAVATRLELSGSERLNMIDSSRLDTIDAETMKALAQGVHVFSAVSPSHKLRIVQALQRAGLVVAMTGDGINDGPALKVADIGVAMGDRGAEVAQMTADVVLEEDDLETMIVAIRQGRAIYENTRSAIHYLLTTNMSEILVMSTGVAAGLGQPLTPMQLLWINLISDIFPVISLATQPPQGDVLERPPRDPNEPFIDRQDLVRMGVQSSTITAGAMGAYLWAIARYGLGPRAGTIGFLSLTVGQVLHMLSARSREHTIISPNRPALSQSFWCTFGAGLGLQAVALLVPGLRGLLGLVPISPLDTGVSLLGATAPLVVNESLKALPGDAPRPVLPASGETSTLSPPTCSSQLV